MSASSRAKRRRVNKLLKETEQQILTEYKLIVNANPRKKQEKYHVAASCQCRLDVLPFQDISDLPLNRRLTISAVNENTDLPGESEAHFESIVEDELDSDDNNDLLRTSLKYWATSYSISLVALSSLLSILTMFHPTLPKDGRTLLGTPRNVPITTIQGGDYYHFGIVKGVLSRLACLCVPSTMTTINIQFNIDGLPLFKSSKLQFWPILGCLTCDYTKSPFVVGIFCGLSKPVSVFEYLAQFVKDLQNVLCNGIIYNGKQFNVEISAFICDAPARAYIKQVKGFNGYSGCDKCFQEGVWMNKMTFPETKHKLRTDSSFSDMVDEEHHIGKSPLSGLVKMVSMFPPDYMHVCCLGVTRKMLHIWLKGKHLATKLPSQTAAGISDKLLKLRFYTPSEFNRKPRGLSEIDRWKATEFRSFMLYWGPVVLKDSLPSELYDNFMLFSVGMYMLLSPSISEEMLAFAQKLMVAFVEHFGELYGKDEIVYNIHQLTHLAEEYRRFGNLDNISGFPFENCLGQIKHLLRKPHQTLQQVVKRLSETSHVGPTCSRDYPKLLNIHIDGPVPTQFISSQQYRKVSTHRFTLSTKKGDNCVEVGDGFALIENIIKSEEDTYIIVRMYGHKQPYYMYPCESSYIGTYKVSGLKENIGVVGLASIKRKCLLCPDMDGAIVIPLLHLA